MSDALVERFNFLRANSLSRINPVVFCPVNAHSLLTVVCEREAMPTVKTSSPLQNGGFLWELGDTVIEWAIFTDAAEQASFAPFFLVSCRDTAHASQTIMSVMRACEQSSLLGVEHENVNGDELSVRLSRILSTGRGVPCTELLGA